MISLLNKSSLFIIIGIFIIKDSATSQRTFFHESAPPDSSYAIQFIALKDSKRTFPSLQPLGKVFIEYISARNLYRYNVGYYDNLTQAEKVLTTLRSKGFKDAFVRKNLFISSLPSRFTVNVNESAKNVTPKPKTENPDATQIVSTASILLVDSIPKLLASPSNIKDVRVNMLYTGKSFGVLGNTRFQSEHEMATEYAVENELEFKLVSHACWRAKGLTVFLPSDDPEGGELDLILKERKKWEDLGPIEAQETHNVLLFQDPDRTDIDILKIIINNKKLNIKYPEIKKVPIKLYRTQINGKMECLIVEEANASWPSDRAHWTIGEINRVDYGKTGRLFELPVNQGGFGNRALLLKELTAEISKSGAHILKIDMGHRNADFELPNSHRYRVDLKGLDSLGYSILMPYEFEFLLGVDSLSALLKEHPSLTLMATNVTSPKNPGLFTPYKLIEIDSVRIGILAVVDPTLETNLSGKILKELKFEEYISATQKTVDKLQKLKPDIIIALSNMKNSDNTLLSENVKGIHLISGNFTDHAINWTTSKEITLNQNEKQGDGAPYDISSIRDFGVEIGRIELNFNHHGPKIGYKLKSISQKSYKVSDRLGADDKLMKDITKGALKSLGGKGELLFPAFIDLIEQNPELENFDAITQNGRISKPLWEKFIARMLTNGAPAEVAIIRKIPTFLPLIGKLHEREVRSWLWFEDEIVLMDMKGSDIKRLLNADNNKTLTTSGIESIPIPGGAFYKIMGRPVLDDVYYKVATTNVISNGVLKEYFRWSIRHSSKFEIQKNGELKDSKNGSVLPVRDYVLNELRRIRSYGKGKAHHKRVAELLEPKLPYQKLFSFNFDRPTLWTSLNRTYKGDGYEAIPESRIISGNSFVIGAEGGFMAVLDLEKSELNFGTRLAFAQQSLDLGNGNTQKTENADDINLNITYRFKGRKRESFRPYTRIEYDSEFTPTINRNTGLENGRQKILRNVIGLSKGSTPRWPIMELGLTAENDFSNSNYQYGFQGRNLNRFPLDKGWNVIYSLTNNFNYYLPNKNDSARDLSFKYNMVHELLIPLFGDISLSMAADLFFFKGKTEFNSEPGMSMLMKVGVSYNRLWKPKFQSLF